MAIWCDKSTDIFYMLFKEGPSHEVIEADPDVHFELDERGRVIGIEIWNAQRKLPDKAGGKSHSQINIIS